LPDVQRNVVLSAQIALARRGLYRGEIDGSMGQPYEFLCALIGAHGLTYYAAHTCVDLTAMSREAPALLCGEHEHCVAHQANAPAYGVPAKSSLVKRQGPQDLMDRVVEFLRRAGGRLHRHGSNTTVSPDISLGLEVPGLGDGPTFTVCCPDQKSDSQ